MVKKTKISYPLTVTDASSFICNQLNISNDPSIFTDSTFVQFLSESATEIAENYIGADIALTSNEVKLYDFYGSCIIINEGNYLELTEIITDSSTLYTDIDHVEENKNSFKIYLNSCVNSDPLTVKFKTGFDPSSNNLPRQIKTAILIKTADLYDIERNSYLNQGISNQKMFEIILNPFKTYYF